MTFAAFGVSAEDPSAVMTVTRLPPSPLLANVNRWERQLGLPESPEAQLGNVTRHADVGPLHVDLVKLLGPDKPGQPRAALMGAIIPQGQEMWFFKMTGPEQIVAGQEANFGKFIQSLRFSGESGANASHDHTPTAGGPPGAPSGAAPAAGGLAKWDAPVGWNQNEQRPGSMRVLSFRVSSPQGEGDVSVIRLGKETLGRTREVATMWRGEVGLPPLAEGVNVEPVGRVTIAGQPCPLYEFLGPAVPTAAAAASAGPQQSLVAVAAQGANAWYFKLKGPAELVAAQRDAFVSFLGSVQFDGTAAAEPHP